MALYETIILGVWDMHESGASLLQHWALFQSSLNKNTVV